MKESSCMGLTSVQYRLLAGMGGVALGLTILNVVIATVNADARKEVNERQQYINLSIQLGQLNNQLVQGLANLSARSGDEELRAVLAQHGIGFSVKGGTPGTSADSAAPTQPSGTPSQGGKPE